MAQLQLGLPARRCTHTRPPGKAHLRRGDDHHVLRLHAQALAGVRRVRRPRRRPAPASAHQLLHRRLHRRAARRRHLHQAQPARPRAAAVHLHGARRKPRPRRLHRRRRRRRAVVAVAPPAAPALLLLLLGVADGGGAAVRLQAAAAAAGCLAVPAPALRRARLVGDALLPRPRRRHGSQRSHHLRTCDAQHNNRLGTSPRLSGR